jgi:predicted anti-sigma-YlaC factor YlaD
MAINKVGDAIANGGSTYESDDDVELVGGALPFGLKLIESLLAESPRHRGLLQAACQGFASYAYLYVQQEADALAERDIDTASRLRARARRLYLRASGYGYRGLERASPGFGARVTADAKGAVAQFRRKGDVPLLYWNAVALGLAISVSKNDASLLARIPEVEALAERALELDESWDYGALHEFQVVFSGAKPGKADYDRMTRHFRRAVELSAGRSAGAYVAYAESFCVPKQDSACFRKNLESALAIDPFGKDRGRLQIVTAQRRARRLLEQIDELILPAAPAGASKDTQ